MAVPKVSLTLSDIVTGTHQKNFKSVQRGKQLKMESSFKSQYSPGGNITLCFLE